MNVSDLPALNASLNGMATVFLVAGWLFISAAGATRTAPR